MSRALLVSHAGGTRIKRWAGVRDAGPALYPRPAVAGGVDRSGNRRGYCVPSITWTSFYDRPGSGIIVRPGNMDNLLRLIN